MEPLESEGDPGPLDALLLGAGASMARDGSAANFGSAIGEVALLQQAVGLADRHELRTFEFHGDGEELAAAIERVTGRRAPAGVGIRAAGAWWLRVSDERALVVCPPASRPELSRRLEDLCPPGAAVSWVELAGAYEALELIGPSSAAVLAAACPGCMRELPSTGRFARVRVGTAQCLVLREAEARFLVLVPRDQAVAAWRALDAAGLDFHIGAVGQEALDRFEVARRTQARQGRA
jgi:glycine cleavage system aminomethyltransferase T